MLRRASHQRRHGRFAITGLILAIGLCVPAAACGGGVGQGSRSAASSTAPQKSHAAAMLAAYLGDVRPPAMRAAHAAARAGVSLRALERARTPSARISAVDAAAAAARRYHLAAVRLRTTPTGEPMRALAGRLIRSYVHARAGLKLVERALSSRDQAMMMRGRRHLDRAARGAIAWQGSVELLLARVGVPRPSWLGRPADALQGLLHRTVANLAAALAPGSSGGETRALQARLAALSYLPPGYRTAGYDYRTIQAVMAFQGWEGLPRDGIAGPVTLRRLTVAHRPQAWSTATRHMELHITQQVLLLVDDGRVVRAIHVSTAAPGHVTPRGTFTIYRKERMSWSVPFQVWMPYASYFTGGYALHEYPDVPPYPASHGCVRMPAGDSIVVWDFATIGTPIVIA